ncbi:MAG: hypothetical protein V1834_00380 [Candidatus Micrarchaeota archaeon]
MSARKGDTNWTPIYLVLVIAIALILIVTFIKPLFKSAGESSAENLAEARKAAIYGLFAITLIRSRWGR